MRFQSKIAINIENNYNMTRGSRCMDCWWMVLLCLTFHFNTSVATVTTFCQGGRSHLECTKGKVLQIKSAFFGRASNTKCITKKSSSTDVLIPCRSRDALNIVRKTCRGKSSCAFRANVKTFGNPCYSKSKYLSIKYNCITPVVPDAPFDIEMVSVKKQQIKFLALISGDGGLPIKNYEARVIDLLNDHHRTFFSNTSLILVDGLMLNRHFNISIRTINDIGYGDYSETLTFKTLAGMMTEFCDYGWQRYNGSCYHFKSTELDWKNARGSCQQKNAELVSIRNKEEQTFLESQGYPVGYAYTGLNDIQKEGKFRWSYSGELFNKTTDFHAFSSGRPKGKDDCIAVYIRTDYFTWHGFPCSVKEKSICKKRVEKRWITPPMVNHTEDSMSNTSEIKCFADAPEFVDNYWWLVNGRFHRDGQSVNVSEKNASDVFVCNVWYKNQMSISSHQFQMIPSLEIKLIATTNSSKETTTTPTTTTTTTTPTTTTTTTTPTTITTTTTTTTTTKSTSYVPVVEISSEKSIKNHDDVTVVVIVVLGIVIVVLVMGAVAFYCKRRKAMFDTKEKSATTTDPTTVSYNRYNNHEHENKIAIDEIIKEEDQ